MENARSYRIRTRWFFKDQRATSVLEMTVMLPFLIALVFGVIEFGRALQDYHTINKSMRNAARFLARVKVDCQDPPSTTCSFVDPGNVTLAKNLALTGYVSGGTPMVSYWTDPNSIKVQLVPYDNTAGDYVIPNQINQTGNFPRIEVTATVPFQDLGMLAVLGLSPITFTIHHNEVSIGE